MASGRGRSAWARRERTGRRSLRAPFPRARGAHDRRDRPPGRASAWQLLRRARRPVVLFGSGLLGRRGRLGRGRRRFLGGWGWAFGVGLLGGGGGGGEGGGGGSWVGGGESGGGGASGGW